MSVFVLYVRLHVQGEESVRVCGQTPRAPRPQMHATPL